MISSKLLLTVIAAGLAVGAAPASASSDPAGDYLPSYTGAQSADLDILGASLAFDGTNFTLSSMQAGAIGSTAGSLFVWGVNRGAGTARLALGSPSIGADVLWDAVVVLFPDATARVVTFPSVGAPTITPLSGAVTIAADSISATFAASLLPSTGFTLDQYTFTLWSRLRVNPAVDGTNAEIADFGPVQSVPEPASWATLLAGLAFAGTIARRRS